MNIKRGDLVKVKATGLVARVEKTFYRRSSVIDHLINEKMTDPQAEHKWDYPTVDQHTVRIRFNGPMHLRYHQPHQLKVLRRR